MQPSTPNKPDRPTRVPKGRVPLLVAKEHRDQAKRLNATWHPDICAWNLPLAEIDRVPRHMLPVRDRPGLAPPYIRINLVPQTSWGRNIRALVDKDTWRAFCREHIYASTGSLCLICGGRGPQWPVEADEVWRFDDAAGVQRLHGIVPLCPACHEVRTAGLATANGRAQAAATHLAWVERITVSEARKRIQSSLDEWQLRSRRTWAIDLSYMEARYGIHLEHDDKATAAINQQLVNEARNRSRPSRTISPDGIVRKMFGANFR